MIEVILNDRLGKKVRVKCKYGLLALFRLPSPLPERSLGNFLLFFL